ncbi:MAG: class I SAM-dependent methyltransferase [Syntrophaceae bacterium]|nr:class I SAM-dependent methyltransferase [Syntrophaceae bacterium]
MTDEENRRLNEDRDTTERYIESCSKDFWQEVFQVELEYLSAHLSGCRDVLSVGCGPAVIEGELSKRGFQVTGLDVSREALGHAPDQIRTIAAGIEDVPFPESSFDAVLYVVSLQFIEDYRKALEKTVLILRPGGRIIVMLLNTGSVFFKDKIAEPDSYVRKIRHTDLNSIERAMAENFQVQTEYFMGVKQGELFESQDPVWSVLYIITGTKPAESEKDKKK